MTEAHWFTVEVNPDPWAIGPLGVGRNKTGKLYPYVGANAQLVAYQDAVRELLANVEKMREGQYRLTFYFWRRLDGHATGRKHYADATNLVKATEDALQGVLFENDRYVRDVRGVIVEQELDTKPMVVLKAEYWNEGGLDPNEIPPHIWEHIDRTDLPAIETDNDWPPK